MQLANVTEQNRESRNAIYHVRHCKFFVKNLLSFSIRFWRLCRLIYWMRWTSELWILKDLRWKISDVLLETYYSFSLSLLRQPEGFLPNLNSFSVHLCFPPRPAVCGKAKLNNISASSFARPPVIIGHSKLILPHPNRHTRLIAFHSSSLDSFDFNLTVDLPQICCQCGRIGWIEARSGVARSRFSHSSIGAHSQFLRWVKFSIYKMFAAQTQKQKTAAILIMWTRNWDENLSSSSGGQQLYSIRVFLH